MGLNVRRMKLPNYNRGEEEWNYIYIPLTRLYGTLVN
jgi:hypothetical protein